MSPLNPFSLQQPSGKSVKFFQVLAYRCSTAAWRNRQCEVCEEKTTRFVGRLRISMSLMIQRKGIDPKIHGTSIDSIDSHNMRVWLVVWNMIFFIFPIIYGECHNPNWRSHIFQRGRYTTNQNLCEFLFIRRYRFPESSRHVAAVTYAGQTSGPPHIW